MAGLSGNMEGRLMCPLRLPPVLLDTHGFCTFPTEEQILVQGGRAQEAEAEQGLPGHQQPGFPQDVNGGVAESWFQDPSARRPYPVALRTPPALWVPAVRWPC